MACNEILFEHVMHYNLYDYLLNAMLSIVGIDFKIKTVELGGKKIKLQIW
jgi:hypothetical protein